MTVKEQLESCIEFVRSRVDFQPEIALVLGSGLGAFAEQLTDTQVLRYSDIPGFPVSTVAGACGAVCVRHAERRKSRRDAGQSAYV